ncbi:hypothetical protein CHLWT_0749 [Campylobacter hyointestinalis subsp. lawsonii]|nr:hypothetical protein CHLWT_0749 [Campylobacter hyointestinalis subsp. lawsonii]RAZ28240.1 hypothetical protein CHLT_04980 [Campylobacter hyointestinalis subsp. lawsonii]
MIFILGFIIITILAIYANVLIYMFAVLVILVIVSLIGSLGMILNMIFGEYLPYILIGILAIIFIRYMARKWWI